MYWKTLHPFWCISFLFSQCYHRWGPQNGIYGIINPLFIFFFFLPKTGNGLWPKCFNVGRQSGIFSQQAILIWILPFVQSLLKIIGYIYWGGGLGHWLSMLKMIIPGMLFTKVAAIIKKIVIKNIINLRARTLLNWSLFNPLQAVMSLVYCLN